MKHPNLFLTVLLCLCGCTGTYQVTHYDLNKEYSTPLGSPMVVREDCRGDTYQLAASLKQCTLRQEIVYSGRRGDFLSFTYREYAGEGGKYRSEPLFTDNFAVNIKHDNVASYKDIYMRVIEANDRSITFTVIDPNKYYPIGLEGGK